MLRTLLYCILASAIVMVSTTATFAYQADPASAPAAAKSSTRKNRRPPLARPRPDIKIDWSRCDAFLRLPLEERDRRLEAFRAALAPAFADYSSDDFRADQRREAERD